MSERAFQPLQAFTPLRLTPEYAPDGIIVGERRHLYLCCGNQTDPLSACACYVLQLLSDTQESPRHASNGSWPHDNIWTVRELLSQTVQMPDNPPRFLCPLPTSKGVVICSCGRCAWTLRTEGDDMAAVQTALDAHRCEAFRAMKAFNGQQRRSRKLPDFRASRSPRF